jgi:group I intron endonuclease
MELSKYEELSNKILDIETQRFCEIYRIINLVNNKIYVGQAVSHILNHRRYRPYGREGRFRSHISEAFSNKKNQSHYLNNAIRKYGVDNFNVELIEYCLLENSDDREKYYINHLNSLYPNGYNLKNGGKTFTHSDESKKRVSTGVLNYYKNRKLERFKNIKNLDKRNEEYIRPLRKNKIQYGWYVYIDSCKADFGGIHISLEDSKQSAINFIEELRNYLATHSNCGKPP